LQDKIAANGGNQEERQLLPVKTQEEFAAEARVSDRTIRDAAKVRDVGTPELLGAEKGKISDASLVFPGRPCGSALRFPVGAPPSAPLDISRKPVGTSGIRVGGWRAHGRLLTVLPGL
jgi:hypothetical protein